jgi:hypothetical protein
LSSIRGALALISLSALGACGGGGGAAAPTTAPAAAPVVTAASTDSRTLPTDAEIADLVYTDRRRVPDGFYAEPMRTDSAYTTVVHLKNTDLDASATPPHELCASDFAGALEWSERAAAARPVYGDLVANDVTPRAWEFTRRLRSTPARTEIVRVYRCDYLDRTAVDLRAAAGPAGRFVPPGWTADDLRGLGEYLWTFGVDNNAGRAVLRSDVSSDASGATHAIVLARLVRASSGSDCDAVELWRLDLRADRSTGALTRSATPLRTFRARRVDGVAQTCG